jgi:plasmid stabilization system protein ParE
MYRAVILPAANIDIQEAALWYNDQQQGLGRRFIRLVRTKVSKILRDPQLYVVRYSDIRTALLDVFPFMIHFSIEEKTKTVLIIAVLHTSRNPALWQEKV